LIVWLEIRHRCILVPEKRDRRWRKCLSDPFKEAAAIRKVLTADETAQGRLDAWLTAQLGEEFSRSRIKTLVKEGAVLLNGTPIVDPQRKVRPGDTYQITLPEPEDPAPKGEDIPLDVLYEDDDVIVLSKPAGLVVHPAAGNWTGTLVNALIHHCGSSLSGIGGVRRPGIVHRLDKDTTGVMVVAKNDVSHRHLSAQFADHGRTMPLERAYQAIVWGRPRQLIGTIDAPLGRATGDRTRRAVKRPDNEDADEAITHYEVLERFHESPDATALASLVECRLETGRTHQIRVHMAHIGHPLLGDTVYGAGFKTKVNLLPEPARSTVGRFPRQALHAFMLQFEHPRTGEVMHFEAPLPDDMETLVEALRA
jgi:23S rRNA pseudouridine1911/1915/1917 synthase